jgi:hypothetical protein
VLDVRRHDDAENTILLVDNYQNMTGLQVSFDGKTFEVSAKMISAISIGEGGEGGGGGGGDEETASVQ